MSDYSSAEIVPVPRTRKYVKNDHFCGVKPSSAPYWCATNAILDQLLPLRNAIKKVYLENLKEKKVIGLLHYCRKEIKIIVILLI